MERKQVFLDVKMSARQWVHTIVNHEGLVLRYFPRFKHLFDHWCKNEEWPMLVDIEGDLYEITPFDATKPKDP